MTAVAGALALAMVVIVATQSDLWPRLWGTSARVESIAVLPLTNLSVDAGSDPFIDGMTDLLIAELSRLKNLRVTARTSVMGYKHTSKRLDEIGQELGVDAVLEASVVMAGPQLRLTASLLRPEDGLRLWTEEANLPFHDDQTVTALREVTGGWPSVVARVETLRSSDRPVDKEGTRHLRARPMYVRLALPDRPPAVGLPDNGADHPGCAGRHTRAGTSRILR